MSRLNINKSSLHNNSSLKEKIKESLKKLDECAKECLIRERYYDYVYCSSEYCENKKLEIETFCALICLKDFAKEIMRLVEDES